MKRCPECGREYDNTMMFCLDDGAELLYGPAAASGGDEPATAILHSTAAPGEAPTRAQIQMTDQTAILHTGAEARPQKSSGDSTEKRSISANRAAKPLAALIVVILMLAGGFVGYRYFKPAGSEHINSIAIVPFVNASGSADTEYLSDGVTESLINSLSRLSDLSVKGRSTMFRYKGKDVTPQQIGSELSVQAVLNGRVVQRGDQITLSLDLVNARTGDQIWGQQYNRKTSDLVSLQAEIASEISQKLRTDISREDRQKLSKGSTTNPEAYQLYLKGNYFAARFSQDGLRKGLDYFNQAIAADPSYGLAYNGLAFYYISANEWYIAPHDAMPKVREAATKALAMDETLAGVHASLAVVSDWYDWDWAISEREFKRAIELDPNDIRAHQFYSYSLLEHGQADEAIAEARRAQYLDPISPDVSVWLGQILLFARRDDEAIDLLRKTVELDDSFWLTHNMLGRAYEQKGRLPEAIAEYQHAIQLEPTIAENRSLLGRALAISGKKADALKIVDELKELSRTSYVSGYSFAIIYAGLGDKDRAFAELERAYNDRSSYKTWLTTDPQLDDLRSDPRFEELLKKVGLSH